MVTVKDLLDAIMALSHNEQGGCWCGFGIGHPLCTGHSKACSRLRDLVKLIGEEQ